MTRPASPSESTEPELCEICKRYPGGFGRGACQCAASSIPGYSAVTEPEYTEAEQRILNELRTVRPGGTPTQIYDGASPPPAIPSTPNPLSQSPCDCDDCYLKGRAFEDERLARLLAHRPQSFGTDIHGKWRGIPEVGPQTVFSPIPYAKAYPAGSHFNVVCPECGTISDIEFPNVETESCSQDKPGAEVSNRAATAGSTPNPPTGLVCVGTHDWKELGVEVCGKPAVTTDVDGEPLCQECFDACPDDDDQGCRMASSGWGCSRKSGHEGPCAARPPNPELEAAIRDAIGHRAYCVFDNMETGECSCDVEARRSEIPALYSSLSSELSRVKEDTRRLDWLIESGAIIDQSNSSAEDGEPWMCTVLPPNPSITLRSAYFWGATPRDVIDRARSSVPTREDGE